MRNTFTVSFKRKRTPWNRTGKLGHLLIYAVILTANHLAEEHRYAGASQELQITFTSNMHELLFYKFSLYHQKMEAECKRPNNQVCAPQMKLTKKPIDREYIMLHKTVYNYIWLD